MKRAFFIAFLALACNRATEEYPSTSASDTTQTTVVLTSQHQQAISITLDSLRQGSVERTLNLRGTIELPPQNCIYISSHSKQLCVQSTDWLACTFGEEPFLPNSKACSLSSFRSVSLLLAPN